MVRVIGDYPRGIPQFVKVVLLFQAVAIVGLSVWMYSEYMSNQYLQMYLISLFNGRGSMIAVLGLGGLLGTALIGILLKAGNILGEIDHLSGEVEGRIDVTKSDPETPMLMPVLRMVEPDSLDEVSRLHGSLRRWRERSKYY